MADASANPVGEDSRAPNWMVPPDGTFPTVRDTGSLIPNVRDAPASPDSRGTIVPSKSAVWTAGSMAHVRDRGACVHVDGQAIDARITCAIPNVTSMESA